MNNIACNGHCMAKNIMKTEKEKQNVVFIENYQKHNIISTVGLRGHCLVIGHQWNSCGKLMWRRNFAFPPPPRYSFLCLVRFNMG
jgi:hypothetical protein